MSLRILSFHRLLITHRLTQGYRRADGNKRLNKQRQKEGLDRPINPDRMLQDSSMSTPLQPDQQAGQDR